MENLETLFHFRKGDKVLRRQKVVGKIASRADGPYLVDKVEGQFLQKVTIRPLE